MQIFKRNPISAIFPQRRTDGVHGIVTHRLGDSDFLLPTMGPRNDFITHSRIAVATSSTLVLIAEPSRIYSLFVNDSDTKIYLFMGTPATINGIPLYPNGGFFLISPSTTRYTGQVTAIHFGSGTKDLNVATGL